MPHQFSQRVADALLKLGVKKSAPLLIGFSGGRDSVALAQALRTEGFERLTLAHLDHALRPESAQDADWVRAYAAERGLPVVAERIEVAEEAKRTGVGLEEAARNARHRFFFRVAEALDCREIGLAHHADDQAETFLFRLLRGSGSSGLAGMSGASVRTDGGSQIRLLRPMLGLWRREVDAFLSEGGHPFLEDPSNASLQFTRNRLRHELLPEMERVMGRPVREAIWRAAELLRAEAEFLEDAHCALGPVTEELLVSSLRALPLAMLRRRVARWLSARGVPDIRFELVEAVSSLALQTTPAKVNLPGGAYARRRAGRIFYEAGSEVSVLPR